jgi:hypothetical protein
MTKTVIYITLLLTGFIWLNGCNSKDRKQPIKMALELTAHLGGVIYLDTTPTIHVSTTLFNPTSDTMSFVTMTCSYEDMFLTDTTSFEIQSRHDCFKNVPTAFQIPPNSKIDQFVMVKPVLKETQANDSKIRIGMYYLAPKTEHDFRGIIQLYEDRKKAKVIWSNEVDLRRLDRKVYQ